MADWIREFFVPLFYQTGYLTLKAYEERRRRYTLGYPNREVEGAIMRNILKVYTHANDDRQGFISKNLTFMKNTPGLKNGELRYG